ncbi:MAG: SpoIID/LytB domain-containing protein [Clostridia bacterium]|nr:SpoIID/LytB domain-containing protein [Clostridia bacterium]
MRSGISVSDRRPGPPPGRRGLCLTLCLLLLLSCLAPALASEEAAPRVRMLLRRLGLTDRIDLRLQGSFLAAWGRENRMLLPSGREITVQVREGRLILFYAEAALDCGTELTLTRTGASSSADPAASGLNILPDTGLYPGDLRLTVSGGQLQPVLSLSVEDYLLGVLPYEMSEDFPLEALKAQAVCARTYALGRLNADRGYDLVDTTNDQVFRSLSADRPRTARAVSETAGVVGTDKGRLASCYYSASNGGQTELPSHVWSGADSTSCYAVADDPYDLENPESILKKAVLRKDGTGLREDFLALLREAVYAQPEMKDFARQEDTFRLDGIQSVSLNSPRFSAPSRLMTRMEIRLIVSGKQYLPPETPEPALTWEADEGEEEPVPTPLLTVTPEPSLRLSDWIPAGTFTLTMDLFPYALRSLNLSIYGADNEIVTVSEEKEAFVLTSGRYGHGVGMSQRGAQWMASEYGKNFQEILAFYYPGMVLKKVSAGDIPLPTPDPLLAETPGPAATPTPRPTLMPVSLENLPQGAWLASVEGIADDSSLNLRAEPSAAGEILMRLYRHQLLIVLETCEDPAWVRVKTDSIEGYVMVSFLEKAE